MARAWEQAAVLSGSHIIDDGMQLKELCAAPVGIVGPIGVPLVHGLDVEQDFVV